MILLLIPVSFGGGYRIKPESNDVVKSDIFDYN